MTVRFRSPAPVKSRSHPVDPKRQRKSRKRNMRLTLKLPGIMKLRSDLLPGITDRQVNRGVLVRVKISHRGPQAKADSRLGNDDRHRIIGGMPGQVIANVNIENGDLSHVFFRPSSLQAGS